MPNCITALLTLVVALMPALAAAAPADAAEEAAIMLQLRAAAVHSAGGQPAPCAAAAGLAGWQPADATHHCHWERVYCDEQQRVTLINLSRAVSLASSGAAALPPASDAGRLAGSSNDDRSGGGSSSSGDGGSAGVPAAGTADGPGLLLPGLARLPALGRLVVEVCDLTSSSIPREWGQPGAFPSLTRLQLRSPGFGGSQLPDILPGALPVLNLLEISMLGSASSFRPTLPPSWGAAPNVLPSLRQLTLQLPIAGPLPPQWAAGFPRLWMLWLSSEVIAGEGAPDLDSCRLAAATAAGQPERRLPSEWASGFLALDHLELNCLRIGGSLPQAWAAGGFPALQTMRLAFNHLNGTLPAHLFAAHPRLTVVELDGNRLTGTLPAEYAASRVRGLSVAGNALHGPAFPPAWLRPGTFVQLDKLSLGGNRQLTGSLPEQLPWPVVVQLRLHETAMNGTVPAAWCRQPLAQSLQNLQVWGTGIAPSLQNCIAALPRLRVHSRRPTDATLLEEAARGSSSNRSAAAAAGAAAGQARLLPLLVLLAGLGASAAAGTVAARRALRQRKRRQQKGSSLELLPTERAAPVGRPLSPEGSSEVAPLVRPALGQSPPLASMQRRVRMVRQLQQAAAGRCGTLELLQLPELHARLAHNLEGGQQFAGAHSGTSSSAMQLLSRQWGLDTASLKLHPGELELTKGADGLPVVIGEGAHAVVMLGRLQGMAVAVKVFELAAGATSQRMWLEVALLRDCVHERLVPLYGVAVSGNLLLLVQRLMRGGSLQAALQHAEKRDALRWEAGGRRVALDIAEGLAFLHARQTLHADLKPSNVLLSSDLRAYLADLSMSLVLEGTARTARGGTACYAAPEQLLGERCTLAADMYSLGVLLCELIAREPIVRRGGFCLPSPGQCPPAVLELIKACLSADPAQRPTAEAAVQLLRHCQAG